jgi:hypothetical protein
VTARRRLVAASLFICAAGLAACSDDDDPGAGPSGQSDSPTAASSSAPTPSGTTSAPTDSTDPTGSPGSTTPTAGGLVVELGDFTIQVPEGWAIYNQTGDHQVVFNDQASNGGLMFVKNPAAFPGEDVDSLARSAIRIARGAGQDPRRVANRTVGGHEGYVIVSSTKAFETYYEWGTPVGKNQVSVAFQWVIKPTNAEETIESVLASIQFR